MISTAAKRFAEQRKRRAPIPRLARRAGLELAARRALDGLYAGMHRTSQLGSSVDFAEHRQLCCGLRRLHRAFTSCRRQYAPSV